MRLLIALVLWLVASVPLALLAGRILGTSTRAGGLMDEIEQYLRLQSPPDHGWRHSAPLLIAATVVLVAAIFGGEAAQQLPRARPVAEHRQAVATPPITPAPRAVQPTGPRRVVVAPPHPLGVRPWVPSVAAPPPSPTTTQVVVAVPAIGTTSSTTTTAPADAAPATTSTTEVAVSTTTSTPP